MNNKIIVSGTVVSEPVSANEIYGEEGIEFLISSERLSGTADVLPCVVPADIVKEIRCGEKIELIGEIRSFNCKVEEKTRLLVRIFANEIKEKEPEMEDENRVDIEGSICKEPIFRKTPLGRDISEFILGAEKKAYLPCIAWGRNAFMIASMQTGAGISVRGRMQSRKYIKKGEQEERTTYELSVGNFSIVKERGVC